MGSSLSLMWAERAVAYTNSKMVNGSSNIPQDVIHMAMKKNTDKVDQMKQQMGAYIESQRAHALKAGDPLKVLGDLAERSGMGNCMERSAIAFNYLAAVGRETGLAMFSLSGGGPTGVNHAFVVLGLDARPPVEEDIRYRETAPNWGAEAVVCDPWYREWFVVADDWTRKGCQILQLTSGVPLQVGTEITLRLARYI